MAGYKKNMAQYENLTGWEKLSLGKQLDKWAVQYGDRIAVADREKEITYLELNQKAICIGQYFMEKGICKGDKVLVQLPNRISFVAILFALAKIGAVPIMMLPAHREAELEGIIELAKPTAYIVVETIFFCTKGDNAFNITENYIKTFLKERLPEYMIPRNIRFMENIPLNVNNKIDRRLLLTMSQSIRETKMTLTNLEEKENLNQNEKIISSIWKEILGIEYVNKKDNFYSVGGDSLLIAQVVTKMRKSIKQLENISWDQLMREVLENPTLEGMSNIISQKEHSIQKMQKTSMSKYIHKYNETENAPVKVISFFHAGTGRLIDYKHMVENLLDKDMSDTQLIGFTYGEYQQYMETPVESLVQDRANLYAETLLEFNVDRYTLVGYCVGGFLALETAKILLENGKKVKLIMIDSRLCQHTISNQLLMEYAYGLSMELDMDNTPYSIKPVMLKEALEKILNGENRNIKNSELTKLSDEYAELGEVFTNLLDMTHEERIKALFNSKKQHNFNGEESTISMLNLLYDIYEHTFNAMMRYRPEGIYSGDITYINATEGIVNFYPDTNVATTWEDMVLGEFKIVNIYANHASIVGAEHSKEILPYIE